MNNFEILLEQSFDKNWNWDQLSQNPNITINIVDKSWYWDSLSLNFTLTIEFIKKYTEGDKCKPWDWDLISRNKNFTLDIIEKESHLPWNWKGM